MDRGRARRRTGALVGLALVGSMAVACAAPPNANVACAWPTRADASILNVAYPDAGATYWATRYTLGPGQRLELSGTYPEARYFSFITYNLGGSALDTLTDRDIAPDAGSDNPFVDPAADPDPANRRYTVTVDADAVVAPGDNALAPSVTPGGLVNGSVILRVYVPDDASDPTGGVGLPSITIRNPDGSAVPIAPCPTQAPDAGIVDLINLFGPATDQPPLDPPTFIRPAQLGGLFANPDNAYVAAVVRHQPGRVVVVRVPSPTFPDTRAGDPPSQPSQLRYWSLCSNEYRKPYPVSACVADHEAVLDGAGVATFVVSTPSDRPANATAADGVTWLDWGSTAVDGLLILRHMLPDPSFPESALGVPPGSPAAATMGAFAPTATTCTTAQFEAGGVGACP